ncbi:MAG TPA: hypothetical protein VL968_08165 [Rhodocyclaceae bacterium]|jgi:hypothetical protein|nr:hypothetical protein [Rhodocyclaceae bacterium]
MASQLVPIDEVAPDTILSEALTDDAGRVLLPAGTQLHAALLSSLKRRGVSRVPVALPDALQIPEAERKEREAQLTRHVDHLFRLAGTAPVVAKLKTLVLAHRLAQGRQDGGRKA